MICHDTLGVFFLFCAESKCSKLCYIVHVLIMRLMHSCWMLFCECMQAHQCHMDIVLLASE